MIFSTRMRYSLIEVNRSFNSTTNGTFSPEIMYYIFVEIFIVMSRTSWKNFETCQFDEVHM